MNNTHKEYNLHSDIEYPIQKDIPLNSEESHERFLQEIQSQLPAELKQLPVIQVIKELLQVKNKQEFFCSFLPTEEKALEFVEFHRWRGTLTCPDCGNTNIYKGKDVKRPYKCRDCNKRFSIKTGTLWQGSNIPIQKIVYLMFLLHKYENISSVEIAKRLQITQKTAWYLLQKIEKNFSILKQIKNKYLVSKDI